VADLARLAGRTEVVVGGMLGTVKHAQTKNPRPGATHTHYAMFDLEDLSGSVRTIIWPEQFAQYGHLIQKEAILVFRAAVDRRPGSDEINLIVNEVVALEDLAGQQTRCAIVRLSEPRHTIGQVEELHKALAAFPGKCELQLQIQLADGSKVLLRCDAVRVEPSDALVARVDELLGPGQLRLLTAPRQPARQNGQRNGAAGRAYARS
jgi:DNA polymerase-3 subunit alpha